jgi:glycerophosphoryl diester phosphodiesterase
VSLLIGHRGARLPNLPENTFAAFDFCLAAGCDGFEFDVRLTADSRLIVCHNSKLCSREVAQTTFPGLSKAWQQKIVPRFSREFRTGAELGVTTLESVLERYAERAFLDIELKIPGLEVATLNALRQNPPQRGFVVSSFLPEALLALHQQDPIIPLGLICEKPRQLALWRELSVGFVIPNAKLVTRELIQELHAAKKRVIVWTVNRERDIRRYASFGADGLVSDDPQLLRRVLGEGPELN